MIDQGLGFVVQLVRRANGEVAREAGGEGLSYKCRLTDAGNALVKVAEYQKGAILHCVFGNDSSEFLAIGEVVLPGFTILPAGAHVKTFQLLLPLACPH